MAQAATAETSSESSPPMRPGKNGGQLQSGNPGNAGGGRPPGAFKSLLARLRESPELAASLTAAVSDSESKAFPAALKLLSEYDEEKPVERKELSGEVVVRVVRDA